MNIWALCHGQQYVTSFTLEPWRIVEAQHILSARDLVDSTEEHALLEDLLEASKPTKPPHPDYLIFTPFRYPPLKYGSRFGSVFEPSLWYGSLKLETALAESAYYRLLFFNDTDADLGYVEVLMTVFSAIIQTTQGIDLSTMPFDEYRKHISAKDSYASSQTLGAAMREAQVDTFIFYSARTSSLAKNVATFQPNVFLQKKGQYTHHHQHWRCMVNKRQVEFLRDDFCTQQRFRFYRDKNHCLENEI